MNMDEIVFPYEEDEDLNNKIVYYEGSRGCPSGVSIVYLQLLME